MEKQFYMYFLFFVFYKAFGQEPSLVNDTEHHTVIQWNGIASDTGNVQIHSFETSNNSIETDVQKGENNNFTIPETPDQSASNNEAQHVIVSVPLTFSLLRTHNDDNSTVESNESDLLNSTNIFEANRTNFETLGNWKNDIHPIGEETNGTFSPVGLNDTTLNETNINSTGWEGGNSVVILCHLTNATDLNETQSNVNRTDVPADGIIAFGNSTLTNVTDLDGENFTNGNHTGNETDTLNHENHQENDHNLHNGDMDSTHDERTNITLEPRAPNDVFSENGTFESSNETVTTDLTNGTEIHGIAIPNLSNETDTLNNSTTVDNFYWFNSTREINSDSNSTWTESTVFATEINETGEISNTTSQNAENTTIFETFESTIATETEINATITANIDGMNETMATHSAHDFASIDGNSTNTLPNITDLVESNSTLVSDANATTSGSHDTVEATNGGNEINSTDATTTLETEADGSTTERDIRRWGLENAQNNIEGMKSDAAEHGGTNEHPILQDIVNKFVHKQDDLKEHISHIELPERNMTETAHDMI